MGFSEQARLSEMHRLAQSRLQTVVAGDVAKVFPLLDVANVDTSFGNYFVEMKKVLTARRTLSSSLSASLYDGIRKDANITSVFTPVLDAAINEKQLFTSLLVTGPVSIKKALKAGSSIEQANANALTSTIRASQRHVANGGRGTIINSVKRDKSAKGWARLTDSKPCSFCALLASRGPVYKSENSSRFRSHDGCGCSAVPVFDLEAPWPGRAEEFRAAYDQNISGKYSGGDGNNDAVKAWKKYYDQKINPDAFNQAKNVAEELVRKATEFEPELTAQMQALADKNGGTLEGLKYRLKSEESLTRKIKAEVADDVTKTLTVEDAGAKMFDVNRYTMKIADENYVDSAQAVIDELRASGNTVKVKNYWLVKDNPYQGINVQVTTPNGMKYELQFHTPKSLEVKEGALHTIYEKSRKTHDPVKIARYNKESFEAAAKIPVPRGVEGIASGTGVEVKAVAEVVKAPKARGYKAKWEEAAAKLPADRGAIGRKIEAEPLPKPTTKEFLIAEARIRAEAKFTDEYTKLNNKNPKTYEGKVEQRRAIEALKAAYGKSIGEDFTLPGWQNLLYAERKASREALEDLRLRLAGGDYDVVVRRWSSYGETKAAGAIMDEHLDSVLAAGKALGDELDSRIAARLASAGPQDTSAIQAALKTKNEIYLAEKAKIEEAIEAMKKDPELIAKVEDQYQYYVERVTGNPNVNMLTKEDYVARHAKQILTMDSKYRRLVNKLNKIESDFTREAFRTANQIKDSLGPIERGTIAYSDIQREETLKLLSEIREMGGKGAEYVSVSGKALLKGELIDAMEFAHSSYPASWMKIVRERFPKVELGKIKRGHNGAGIEIKLSDGARQLTGDQGLNAVAVHELGHSMQEAIPGLKQLDFAYRSRRGLQLTDTGEAVTERAKWIGAGSKDEVAIHDAWRNAYSGKIYGANDPKELAEVFTTGMESLVSGSPYMNPISSGFLNPNPARLVYDEEFRNYMLGVLSVL